MTQQISAEDFLAGCTIDPAVAELRPDYRVMLLVVDGLEPAESNQAGEQMLGRAESHAVELLEQSAVQDLPHIAAWREAYRAFGAKPQRTRNSLEALTRRAVKGLPRINALTDIYNAISVLHQIPLGGEDLSKYDGPARLVRATGDEEFDTAGDGEMIIEHPEPGEVTWQDGAGVTCRRWNWRQCRRTGLQAATTTALFILDALEPMSDDQLTAAADALEEALGSLGSDVRVARRLLSAS